MFPRYQTKNVIHLFVQAYSDVPSSWAWNYNSDNNINVCAFNNTELLSYNSDNKILIDSIGVSAESIAIGRVMGTSTHANAVFANPASLFRINRYSISAFNLRHMNRRVNFFNLSTAYRYQKSVFGTQ